MKSVEQHVADVLALIPDPVPTELDLLQAHGAVLAEAVTSPVSLPGFDNSSMDGYAVRAADLESASPDNPVRLPVVADIPAGDPSPTAVLPGRSARIMTGAPMPSGADAVVPVEWTDGGTASVTFDRPVKEGNAVRRAFSAVTDRFPNGQTSVTGGIAVEKGETQAAVEVTVVVEYGASIVEVGNAIRRNVIEQVEGTTGLEVIEVNVNVVDVHLPGQDDEPAAEQRSTDLK